MKVKVRIEPEAEQQAEDLIAWWREHRPAAKSLREQLREAFDRIMTAPYAAPVYEKVEGEDVRRLLIRSTPYAVYYYVDETAATARVISLWSGQRGEGPPLKVR